MEISIWNHIGITGRKLGSNNGQKRTFTSLAKGIPRRLMVVILAALVGVFAGSPAGADSTPIESLKRLSLEELANLEVSIASRTPERLSDTAAAAYIITQEDLRRSGVTTIPEALRLVPGFQVARIDDNKWAVTARGFNGRFTNKLLVLIDGRTVYSPTFSGVYWDLQGGMLEDVERIEIIRGPGAVVWGANAVNGVVNVITKNASDTQGTLVSAGFGTDESFATIRHGGTSASGYNYRTYLKARYDDESQLPSGEKATDNWRQVKAGFRVDRDTGDSYAFRIQGDVVSHRAGQRIQFADLQLISDTIDEKRDQSGINILASWDINHDDGAVTRVQGYAEYLEHQELEFDDEQYVFDMEVQHNRMLGENHSATFGFGYHFLHDSANNNFLVSFDPDMQHDNLVSAFVQDEISLWEGRGTLTIGSKFENNSATGFELQPSARLLWRTPEGYSLWASASRAVRTPSIAEQHAIFNQLVLPPSEFTGGLPVLVRVVGNPELESEVMNAFEFGFRGQLNQRVGFDLTAYFHDFTDLRASAPGDTFMEFDPMPPHLVSEVNIVNSPIADVVGLEAYFDWRPSDRHRLQAGYTWIDIEVKTKYQIPGFGPDPSASPRQQFSLRSSVDVREDLDFDLWLRYVDELHELDIDDYVNLDARLAWRPGRNFEISLVGRNLFSGSRLEYRTVDVATAPTVTGREIFLKATWRN